MLRLLLALLLLLTGGALLGRQLLASTEYRRNFLFSRPLIPQGLRNLLPLRYQPRRGRPYAYQGRPALLLVAVPAPSGRQGC